MYFVNCVFTGNEILLVHLVFPLVYKSLLMRIFSEFMSYIYINVKSSLKYRLTMELNTDSLSSNEKNPISAFMEYGQAREVVAKLESIDQEGPDNEPM